MQARWRVVAIDNRVDSGEEYSGILLVAWHHNYGLGGSILVQYLLDAFVPSQVVDDELVDTEKPRNREQDGERPKGKPLQE